MTHPIFSTLLLTAAAMTSLVGCQKNYVGKDGATGMTGDSSTVIGVPPAASAAKP